MREVILLHLYQLIDATTLNCRLLFCNFGSTCPPANSLKVVEVNALSNTGTKFNSMHRHLKLLRWAGRGLSMFWLLWAVATAVLHSHSNIVIYTGIGNGIVHCGSGH